MLSTRALSYTVLAAALITTACRSMSGAPTNGVAPDAPALQLGEADPEALRALLPTPPQGYEACSLLADATQAKANAYLRRIAADLVKASPALFADELQLAKMCISVARPGAAKSRVVARRRSIEIARETLILARSDAEVAADVARGLARVLLQQDDEAPVKSTPRALDQAARAIAKNDAAFRKLNDEYEQLLRQQIAVERVLDKQLPEELRNARLKLYTQAVELMVSLESYGEATADMRSELAQVPVARLEQRDALLQAAADATSGKTPLAARDAKRTLAPGEGTLLWQSVARIKAAESELSARERKAAPTQYAVLARLTHARVKNLEAYDALAEKEENLLETITRSVAAQRAKIPAKTLQTEAKPRIGSSADLGVEAATATERAALDCEALAIELYLKAGFAPELYRSASDDGEVSPELADCRARTARLGTLVAREPAPSRIHHPLPCWRIADLEVLGRFPRYRFWRAQLPLARRVSLTSETISSLRPTLLTAPQVFGGIGRTREGG